MAVKKGTSVSNKPGMKEQTSSNIARDGAAKRPQTSFADHSAMRSRIGNVPGVGGKGSGPDASSPNPIDPTVKGKTFPPAGEKWGMKDANGKGVDHELGKRVLNEGVMPC
jgi:hypothetical protein